MKKKPSPGINDLDLKRWKEYGDIITAIDGQPATVDSFGAFSRKKPGESAVLTVLRRGRQSFTATVTLRPNPALLVAPAWRPVWPAAGTPANPVAWLESFHSVSNARVAST